MSIKPATDAETAALALAERNGWPQELRALLDRYPREVWAEHENLGQMCQFWLSRHNMFRELAAAIEDAMTRYRDGKMAAPEFVNFFAPRLQFFLQQLHVHHQIEDFHYFPIFRKAEARLIAGFDVLEADHGALHHDIESTVSAANELLRSFAAGGDTLKRAGDSYADASGALFKGLKRHLDDEEDLIVPLILDRSEHKLGIGH
jgi:hemerythrin-like domain-containing protein